MYNFFGVQWDVRSAVFWIVVAQAIFILIAAIVIAVLIVRIVKAKNRAKRAALLPRRNTPMVLYRGSDAAPYCVTHVYTTPDFSDSVEEYVEKVLKRTRENADSAQQRVNGGQVKYYTNIYTDTASSYTVPPRSPGKTR